MRYKVAPPARSLSFLGDARAAIPLVPDDEADCCRAIQRATDVTDRETAREYLTFLRALDLVDESDRGYHRTRTELDQSALAVAFRENVFAASELLDALDDCGGPLTETEAFERVRDAVPRWERERHADWERVWRTRLDHLLGWAEAFGLAARTDDGYERR
ncbi:hypothetical protein [Haloarcula nitratireducens]|uniref:Uncharacterized protein n=1 Tax=Haloarcula nitratireducens TaxID=2487749 RepID=A0AAW4P9X8_9EURY|nr:hypothetical protein [Halomicroarcula nitratireducens]MBX0294891.1 hypothetical protein [Halomicroarcula nitratireducens]